MTKATRSEQLAHWLVEKRNWLFFFSIITILAIAKGTAYLKLETDYKIFFEKDDPHLLAHELIQNTYSKADNVFFILAPKDGKIFKPETLTAIEELTEKSWTIPYSTRVESITNHQHTFAEGDDLLVENLVEDAYSLTSEQLKEKQQIAVTEHQLVNRLISPQAHVAGINVQLSMPEPNHKAVPEAVDYARQLREEFLEKYPDLEIHMIGQAVINRTFNELAVYDSTHLMPALLLIIVVLVGVFLRSAAATFATVIVIFCGVLVTFGFMGWTGLAINNVNAGSPNIIITLAVADCVHLLANFLTELRQGRTKIDALKESITINLQPIFLTSLTTAFGFLGMTSSDSPPFASLGVIAAFGVMAVFVLTLTMLPALIYWFPVKAVREKHDGQKLMIKLSEFVIAKKTPLFYGSIIVIGIIVSFIPRNNLNDDTIAYFNEKVPLRISADFAEKHLTGIDVIEYSLDSGEQGGINNPEYLKKVEAFVEWYRSQSETRHVLTYTDVIKNLNKNMHADDQAWYNLPDDQALASQYLLLYELSLPFGMDLNNQINVDKSALRITVVFKNMSAEELLATEEKAQTWFKENAPELATLGASPSIMFAHVGQNNIHSMLKGSVISVILITITLIIALRSIKWGLLSFIPNAFPAAVAFGMWGYFVGEVDLGVAAVFTGTIGIVVDDTVHFLSKYLRARRTHGKSPRESVDYAFRTVGKALLVTTVVIVCGFSVMLWSDFAVNSNLGAMMAMTVAIALIFDFFFLPTLLLKVDKNEEESKDTVPSIEVPAESAP